jgi:hypothetical protein
MLPWPTSLLLNDPKSCLQVFNAPWLHPPRSHPSQLPLRAARTMTSLTAFLGAGSSITTMANSVVASWPMASSLATRAYDALRLRTQVDRLRDVQDILFNVVWEDNYLLLSPARRGQAMIAIRRYVLVTPIVCSYSRPMQPR